MQIRFVKMEGLGNDFMVAEWPKDAPEPRADTVSRWADRRFGIGFDSLLLVQRRTDDGSDAAYRVLNADGGEAQQCGNGARCIAAYLTAGEPGQLQLSSLGGRVSAEVLNDGRVRLCLGEPNFEVSSLPFLPPQGSADGDSYSLDVDGSKQTFRVCSMSNPHAVISVDSVAAAEVARIGAAFGAHEAFPEGVNVGFCQRLSRTELRLRVSERGIGETMACGTGAAAAMAVGRLAAELDETVDVRLPGGILTVSWPGPGEDLWQTGAATTVYEGSIRL